jgi:hypothetical protein
MDVCILVLCVAAAVILCRTNTVKYYLHLVKGFFN